MFNGCPANSHGIRASIQASLHALKYLLMNPATNSTLACRGALLFDWAMWKQSRTPIASYVYTSFLGGKPIDQSFTSQALIHIHLVLKIKSRLSCWPLALFGDVASSVHTSMSFCSQARSSTVVAASISLSIHRHAGSDSDGARSASRRIEKLLLCCRSWLAISQPKDRRLSQGIL